MRYNMSDKKVLKKLNIQDFRHMTKDKVVDFMSMIPRMDPEVAKAAIDQFPEFKDMAIQMTAAMKETISQAFNSADQSQQTFYDACHNILHSLDEQLKDDRISAEERASIRDDMIRVATLMSEKDDKHKLFILRLAGIAVGGIGAIAVTAASLLGVNLSVSKPMSNDADDADVY